MFFRLLLNFQIKETTNVLCENGVNVDKEREIVKKLTVVMFPCVLVYCITFLSTGGRLRGLMSMPVKVQGYLINQQSSVFSVI